MNSYGLFGMVLAGILAGFVLANIGVLLLTRLRVSRSGHVHKRE
ncbi:MAG: hypothetical protein ACYCRD_04655 [Leptospirillum sp.]